MPYKRIAEELGVGVGSVHLWTSDIELTAEQRERILRRQGEQRDPEHMRRMTGASAAMRRARRQQWQEQGRSAARLGDSLHHAGCMLYWAEGGKDRNRIQFTNSDVQMLAVFRRFLTDALGVPRTAIRLTINVYTNNGLSIDEIQAYWLARLDLPVHCVRAHTLNHMPTSSSGRGRRLPYGVCTLRVNSTANAQHIFGAIQEYAGFEEPAWLD